MLQDIKEVRRERLTAYATEKETATYYAGSVWDFDLAYDIALPCATQNEIGKEQAERLVKAGVYCVSEGANMPSTLEAVHVYAENNIYYGPAKAANAGGVATSALEMAQNSAHSHWSFEEVDNKLKEIMENIFKTAEKTAEAYGMAGNYLAGANIASFVQVADAMMYQGLV